jgi:4-amino-4-deoxy-L-arabinose transferase-like glycosyltransferase
VRAFSGAAALACLPLVWLAGRRLGGRRVAWAALIIMATSPFAARYATETRMYSLVALEALIGFLALTNALERPTWLRLAGVTAVTALLLYTHYWAIYLLAAVGCWLAFQWWRDNDPVVNRRTAGRAMVAMAVGGLAFVPWLPIFLYQAHHTGTPWAQTADFGALVSVIQEFAGGGAELAQILAIVLLGLVMLGLMGRAVDDRHVVLDLRTRPQARGLAAVLLFTPAIAIAIGMATGTAFVARYTSVVFPVFCLLAGMGIAAFASRRARVVMLACVAALGLACGIDGALAPRTEAGLLAAGIQRAAQPGDVVAFCPDQLGPAVIRRLPAGPMGSVPGVKQITYPRGTPPGRIDWVDYDTAIKASPVSAFARRLVDMAGPDHHVLLVWGRGYRPYNGRCTQLAAELTTLRGSSTTVVANHPVKYFEHGTLVQFP